MSKVRNHPRADPAMAAVAIPATRIPTMIFRRRVNQIRRRDGGPPASPPPAAAPAVGAGSRGVPPGGAFWGSDVPELTTPRMAGRRGDAAVYMRNVAPHAGGSTAETGPARISIVVPALEEA